MERSEEQDEKRSRISIGPERHSTWILIGGEGLTRRRSIGEGKRSRWIHGGFLPCMSAARNKSPRELEREIYVVCPYSCPDMYHC
jgi:hypothetical protein